MRVDLTRGPKPDGHRHGCHIIKVQAGAPRRIGSTQIEPATITE